MPSPRRRRGHLGSRAFLEVQILSCVASLLEMLVVERQQHRLEHRRRLAFEQLALSLLRSFREREPVARGYLRDLQQADGNLHGFLALSFYDFHVAYSRP